MKKRWISLLVALALTVSAFAGCGSGDTVPAADDNSASSGEGNGELEYAELDWYLDLGEKPELEGYRQLIGNYAGAECEQTLEQLKPYECRVYIRTL